MSVWESMEMRMCGRHSLNSSITCHWPLSSKARSSASMVVSPPQLTLSIKSDNSIASKKCLMKDLSAICYGLTLMIAAAGVSLPEVLAIPSVKTSPSSSTMPMDLNWYRVPINLWWVATIGLMKEMLSPFSQPPTTAIDAVTRQLSWKSMNLWSILSCNLTQHPDKLNPTLANVLQIISYED